MPVLPLFIVTVFVSASLLFLVQPMFARMVLPLLGGSPAVWNTCMVFFQAALLAGYLYAHLTTKWLASSRQVMVHLLVLLLPWVSLPIGARILASAVEVGGPPADANPLPWLLMILAIGVGLPFFVVSASAPLLQRWFSHAGHATSHDPYFLYAASNAGSMIALLSYPLIVEPALSLSQQGWLWTIGYVLMMVMMAMCAAVVLRKTPPPLREGAGGWVKRTNENAAFDSPADPLAEREGEIAPRRLFRWIALALVPSSLMLGVTMHITTDLVVAPLLWVIPLAAYLLSFILVFAKRRLIPHAVMVRAMPIIVVVLLLMMVSHATEPLLFIVVAHLLGLFIISMVCHGELANDRPHARHLTTFYLMLGVGGVLGGAFNAIAAPLLFNTIIEYPIAIVLACLLAPSYPLYHNRVSDTLFSRALDVLLPLGLLALAVGAIVLANQLHIDAGPARLALVAGLPVILCFLLSRRPVRFGLAVAAVFLAGSFETIHHGTILTTERSFFGVHRVARSAPISLGETITAFNRLYHGTTLHGSQRIDIITLEPINSREPLGYYHRLGPVGRVFAAHEATGGFNRVGLVGLGVGAIAAYAERDQHFAFYEIDPLVKQIAEDAQWFTYLGEARRRGAQVPIVLGDARLTLAREDDAAFDLLILDAFTSDAIPIHLLTTEAVAMYARKVKVDGLIAMHISSRYFDLEPLLAAIAGELNLVCLIFDDIAADEGDGSGRMASKWAVLAQNDSALQTLRAGPDGGHWLRASSDPRVRAWTDDYANILSVLVR